jgi:hypothetical protein
MHAHTARQLQSSTHSHAVTHHWSPARSHGLVLQGGLHLADIKDPSEGVASAHSKQPRPAGVHVHCIELNGLHRQQQWGNKRN